MSDVYRLESLLALRGREEDDAKAALSRAEALFLLAFGLALVALLARATDAQLHLEAVPEPVEGERHERAPALVEKRL